MELEIRPVNKVGERNYQCREYDSCEAHAGKSEWSVWSCSECPNQLQGTGVSVVGSPPMEETRPAEPYTRH